VPAPPDGFSLVGDAYRIASSHGDRLAATAMLEFDLDVDATGRLRNRRELQHPSTVRLSDDGRNWVDVGIQQQSDRHIGARINQLGTYALIVLVEGEDVDRR
jgi:hypothetical protein